MSMSGERLKPPSPLHCYLHCDTHSLLTSKMKRRDIRQHAHSLRDKFCCTSATSSRRVVLFRAALPPLPPPSPSIQDFSLFPALRMVVCVFLPSLSLLVFIHFAFGVMGDTSACGMRASQDHIPGPCAEPTPVPPPYINQCTGPPLAATRSSAHGTRAHPTRPSFPTGVGSLGHTGGGGALGGDRHSGTGCEATCRAWGGGCARIADRRTAVERV